MNRLGVLFFFCLFACDAAWAESTASGKSGADVRAARRLFDGAPPTIPHPKMGAACIECHNERGLAVEGVGFSPPSPHEKTAGMSAISNCAQCHVYTKTDAVFRKNGFAGLKQDLRKGRRLNAEAPPTMPHKLLMRENCAACHTGPAARDAIRTSHPERINCQQCHVAVVGDGSFAR